MYELIYFKIVVSLMIAAPSRSMKHIVGAMYKCCNLQCIEINVIIENINRNK